MVDTKQIWLEEGFKAGQKELLKELLDIYNGESYYILEVEMKERLKILSKN